MTIRGEGNKNTQKTSLHKSIKKSKKKKKEWLFLMVTFTKGFFASNCIKNEGRVRQQKNDYRRFP